MAGDMNASLLVSETTEACVSLHETNGLVSASVYEADEQLNDMLINVNEIMDTFVSEPDEEPGMSLHEAEGPGVSKDEYLHDGW